MLVENYKKKNLFFSKVCKKTGFCLGGGAQNVFFKKNFKPSLTQIVHEPLVLGKQRTKKEAALNTNQHNPAGHERKVRYIVVHKTLPKFGLSIHWTSARFYEMGVTCRFI